MLRSRWRTSMRRGLVAVILASCASRAPSQAPAPAPPAPASDEIPPGPDVTPSFAPVSWILGDWQRDGVRGSEHWFAAAGALYGVALTEPGYEVMIIDDAATAGPADGKLRFLAMPGGRAAVEYGLSRAAAQSVTFANPTHDFPTAITYSREADRLRAALDGPPTAPGAVLEPYHFHRFVAPPAPALEEADRAFARASLARGAEAWVAAFEPKGSIWRAQGGMITGSSAIRSALAETLAGLRLEWEPVYSRDATTADLGFTVGKYIASDPATAKVLGRGSYVTIWRKQRDGSWKVVFDTGRPENRP